MRRMRRATMTFLGVLSAATLTTLYLAVPASAEVRPAGLPPGAPFLGYAVLYSEQDSQLCLDANTNDGGKNGNRVQVWKCFGSTPANQQDWAIYQNVASGSYYLVNRMFNKCLDADLNSIGRDGTTVQLWACTGGQNQQWHPAIGWNFGIWQHMYNDWPGAGAFNLLDADNNGGLSSGRKVQLWSAVGGPNQAWGVTVSGKPA